MSAPPHDDRKGHHYYIRMRRPVKPEYSSDDPCGHHGMGGLVTYISAMTGTVWQPPSHVPVPDAHVHLQIHRHKRPDL